MHVPTMPPEHPVSQFTHLDRIDQRNPPLDFKYIYYSQGTGANVFIADTGVFQVPSQCGAAACQSIEMARTVVLRPMPARRGCHEKRYAPVPLSLPTQCHPDFLQSGSTQADCETDASVSRVTLSFNAYSSSERPDDYGDTWQVSLSAPIAIGAKAQLTRLCVPDGLPDWVGHGTHVASLAAGNQAGVAKSANIYSFKVADDSGSLASTALTQAVGEGRKGRPYSRAAQCRSAASRCPRA